MDGVTPKRSELIPPYHGKLINLFVDQSEYEELAERAIELTSIRLSPRSVSNLELLATGALSPLDRFMGKADYTRVMEEMRLANGALFPIPVTLPICDASSIRPGEELALRNLKNDLLAIMTVEDVFENDPTREADLVLGSKDLAYPLTAEATPSDRKCISGPLKVLNLPRHYDFPELRKTPKEVREMLQALKKSNVVAFQTQSSIRRAHEEFARRVAEEAAATLLIHLIVGLIKPGDLDYYMRVRVSKSLVEEYYDKSRTVLALLPLAMRMASPRDALCQGIIGRNYGANYLIMRQDHAGAAGRDSGAKSVYGPNDAEELLQRLAPEIGVKMIPFREVVGLPNEPFHGSKQDPAGAHGVTLSGTEVASEYPRKGAKSPEWLNRPETAAMPSESYSLSRQNGFCVWFTGLSGAGKSTLAEILVVLLMQHGRAVTLLDGDIVRTHLSKGLGFSKEDRDTNVRRIGFVASEIVRHHGVVVCATVSPYRAARSECRHMVGDDRFIEIFLATPLDVRERRDTKRMYARARTGQETTGFSGFNEFYEEPLNPEIRLTTTDRSPEEDAGQIITYLIERGFLSSDFTECIHQI